MASNSAHTTGKNPTSPPYSQVSMQAQVSSGNSNPSRLLVTMIFQSTRFQTMQPKEPTQCFPENYLSRLFLKEDLMLPQLKLMRSQFSYLQNKTPSLFTLFNRWFEKQLAKCSRTHRPLGRESLVYWKELCLAARLKVSCQLWCLLIASERVECWGSWPLPRVVARSTERHAESG